MRKLRKHLAVMLSVAMVFSVMPQLTMADDTYATVNEVEGSGEEETTFEPIDYKQAVIDEAKELGVPDAFIKHSFATDYEDGKLEDPEFELQEGEKPKYKMDTVVSAAGVRGLEIKSIDTGLLARTKFDLGTFDFGDMKVGYLIYNILAKKTMKGKGYLYLDQETEPFLTLSIKRTGDSDWEEIRNKAIDVRNMELQGTHSLSFRFIADSAKDDNEQILATSGVKGSLFLESLFFTEGSTPVLDFDIDNEVNSIDRVNGSELHSIMGYGNMNVKIPEGYECEYGDTPVESATYELDYIKGRGNSTWLASKKPYKIKLDKSTDLFNMGKSKHWVLLANYYDYSLLRNKMTFELAKQLGLEYTPKSVFVDVVIDGEYCGSYQLSQHIRIGKGNIDLDDLEEEEVSTEPEITGGYLLSMGESWLKGDEGKPRIEVGGFSFLIEKPEYDASYSEEAKQAQINYLTDYLNALDQTVGEYEVKADKKGEDVEIKDWRDYMDEQSYIDYYLIQEISKNGDAYNGSTYLYKKRDGKLYWGPVWDFDFVAWGAAQTDYLSEGNVEGFYFLESNPWFTDLLEKDPKVKEKVIERWGVMSEILKNLAKDGGFIDQWKEQLYYSALANYQVRASYLMDNVDYWSEEPLINLGDDGKPYQLNYTNEIDRLKRIVNVATLWMDENIGEISSEVYDDYPLLPFMIDGEVVAQVRYNARRDKIIMEDIPEAPKKEGMVFKGWYYKDEDGVERRLYQNLWPYYVEYEGESEEELEKLIPYTFYAKYIPEGAEGTITQINTLTDVLYVPLQSWGWEWESQEADEIDYESQTLYLDQFVSVLPASADSSDIEYYVEEENDGIEVLPSGEVTVFAPGEYVVNCSAGKVVKQIKIIGVDSEEVADDTTFSVAYSIKLKQGEYGNIGFEFGNKKVSFDEYLRVGFKSLNTDIVTVDKTGTVHAKGAGETKILAVYSYGSEMDMKLINVTVEANETANEPTTKKEEQTSKTVCPPAKNSTLEKAVIKKIYKKKKTAKKIKLKLSKVKGAKGYQIYVYETKKQAKNNKSPLVKKYVKSVKVTLKSQNFKNKKKLFVKVRAYQQDGKVKKYGAWSDIKKIQSK